MTEASTGGALLDKVRAQREAREAATEARAHQADTRRVGRESRRRGHEQGDVLRDVHEEGRRTGREEVRRPAAGAGRRRRPSSSLKARAPWNPPRTLSASDGAGFLLGVFAWAIVLNFLRGGPGGVTKWLRAKFFGEAAGASST